MRWKLKHRPYQMNYGRLLAFYNHKGEIGYTITIANQATIRIHKGL